MKTIKSIIVIVTFLLLTSKIQAQEVFDAILNNDLTKVKELIEKDVSLINLKDTEGNTPLHKAGIAGFVPITEFILSKGADINSVNNRQNTPLIESIINGKNDVSKLLIERGADINKRNTLGLTPLHFSVRYSSKTINELLIAKGADIESKSNSQFTPLYLAAGHPNNLENVKLLIDKGASLNTRADAMGNMPLNYAAYYGSPETIDLLLDKGADFDTSGINLRQMVFSAANRGLERLFKVIVGKYGDFLFKNEVDNISLMKSATAGGSVEIVKILLAKNIPINVKPNANGWTPLHFAASRNKPAMIELLAKNGADINIRTNDGRSVYNLAEENGHKDALDLIIKLGGNSEPQKFPVLKGSYLGQIPPEKEFKRFAPGIVETDHSSISVSPDGKEIYWGTGTSIMMTKLINGQWIKPVYATFSGESTTPFYDDNPFVSTDNKKLFFTSRRPKGGTLNKANIWYVERTSSGWSDPKPISDEVNSFGLHWLISVSNSGTLFFGGSGPDDNGKGDLYYSKLVNGEYTKPANLGPTINSKEPETQPFIAPDESYLIYTRVNAGRPTPYISFKSKEGQWLEPISLKDYLGEMSCLIVSPDGKYIFAQTGWWRDASFIEELRPKE